MFSHLSSQSKHILTCAIGVSISDEFFNYFSIWFSTEILSFVQEYGRVRNNGIIVYSKIDIINYNYLRCLNNERRLYDYYKMFNNAKSWTFFNIIVSILRVIENNIIMILVPVYRFFLQWYYIPKRNGFNSFRIKTALREKTFKPLCSRYLIQ